MPTLPLRSETGVANHLIFLVGAAFFAFIGYKTGESFQNPFSGSILLLTTLVVLLCLTAPWLYYTVIVYHNSIDFRQLGGLRSRQVLRQDLVAYELLQRKSKFSSWPVLTLHTRDDHFTIDSRMYANFPQLQQELTAHLPLTYVPEKHSETLNSPDRLFLIVLFWVVMAAFIGLSVKDGYSFNVNEYDLVPYACTLHEKPAIKKTTGRRPTEYLSLSVTEHPLLDFDISGSALNATHYAEFIQNRNAGDSIFIRISREDYQTKIRQEKPPEFWGTPLGLPNNFIDIYELKASDNLGYLTIPDYEFCYRSNNIIFFWLCLVVIIVVPIWYRSTKK